MLISILTLDCIHAKMDDVYQGQICYCNRVWWLAKLQIWKIRLRLLFTQLIRKGM